MEGVVADDGRAITCIAPNLVVALSPHKIIVAILSLYEIVPGLTVYEISRNSSDQRDRAGVRLATMHRVKGLEFDHVIIVAANKGVVPLDPVLASADDKITERDRDTGERALLYVALTRAKKAAMITATGQPSSYLNTAVGR